VISAVVLAAGLSTRMGRLKLLLPYGEYTVIEQVVSVLLSSPVDEVLVVTGHERAAVEAALARWPVRTVFNPDYAVGEMLSSAQVGLRSMAADAYIPSYRMQAGHPVLIPRPFWPAILALPAGADLRSVWRAEGTRVQWVGVDTPSVLRDMDTPEDYEQELRVRG